MENTKVFGNFDMVVSMKQETINEQLGKLADEGVVPNRLKVLKKIEKGSDPTYERLKPSKDVPTDDDGDPKYPYVDAKVRPEIEITETGQAVTLVLKFESGKACFSDGFGPYGELKEFDDVGGWQYAIPIDLALERIDSGEIEDMRLPDQARKQLTKFDDAGFGIDHLFLDLENSNLVDQNTNMTHVHGASDAAKTDLGTFMKFYLEQISGSDNPFVLGYSLDATDADTGHDVPPSMKPAGTTYSMYHDDDHPEASTLNFVMVTEGGHGKITSGAPKFDSNWIDADDDCQARMIYSRRSPIEQFVLEPIYEQIRDRTYQKINDHVDVGKGHSYAEAKSPTGKGYHFVVSDVTGGKNRYHNVYSVDFDTSGSKVQIEFYGNVRVYKRVSQDDFFCTARAHAKATVEWSATITIEATENDGSPSLSVEKHTSIDSQHHDHSKNQCAEAFEWIGKILGGILDAFTGWADEGYLSNLFADAMSVDVPNVGNLDGMFANLSNAPQNVVMLPAGEEFAFEDPAINHEGDFMLDLTAR